MSKKLFVFLILLVLITCPVLSLTEIRVKETELVDLEIRASDPDKEDTLAYAYSKPTDSKGKWQTSYGDAGAYNITVTVSDGKLSSSEQVLLVVEKKDEAPIIEAAYPDEEEINIKEGSSVNFKIKASDLNKDKLSYLWELDGKKVSETDHFSYFSSYKSSGDYALNAYTSDGKLTAKKEWKINVKEIDRAPIFMPVMGILAKETQKVTIYLNATDPDDDAITYSAVGMPEGATLSGNVFSWFPGYDAVKKQGFIDSFLDKYHLVMDSYAVKFTAKGKEAEATQNVRITVLDVNRKPVLCGMEDMIVTEEDAFTIKATASDPDGDALKFSYSGWTDKDSYKTSYGDAGEHIVRVAVSDGWLTDSRDVKIIVKKKNRAPIFMEIGRYAVNEGQPLSISLMANDPDGDALAFSLLGMNITNSSINGNVFEWMPAYSTVKREPKDFVLEFSASDGNYTATRDAVITVNNVDIAPNIAEASPKKEFSVRKNEPVVFKVAAEDPDGDEIRYDWVFGLFETHENFGNTMKRVFTAEGDKKVKVIVSAGGKEAEYEWNVKVR